ncbi:MAG: TetR/AcrR family transcriptional regulator C-terminal domain-containing protein [Acidimicrobiales bacterium]|jgi:TetR/AcrR family tetracycline transcriptional repressor|nr:TetR/AcrR family transcriptional regulator C-terminal domain-containing protein [Actinomycetota bacterium]
MQLHREDVLDGALTVLEGEGLDGLTMRRLASHLGVQPGALYWHFANKQALLDAMADRLVEGVGEALPTAPWDGQLEIIAARLRHALLAHRDGARLVAGTYVDERNTRLVAHRIIDVLEAAGLPLDRAAWVGFALSSYVLGHTIEEQAQADLVAGRAWADKVHSLNEPEDPRHARAFAAFFDADPAERFAYGLRVFLDGIRHQLRVPEAVRGATAPRARADKARADKARADKVRAGKVRAGKAKAPSRTTTARAAPIAEATAVLINDNREEVGP